ncbi:MAG TPA: bifunctional DNA-formamidopyrimidine glycosylase/DNA-(apurinic or apyrimidinic site) lyase [Candidatus Limnocylindria bacterium]|jgi:formamidopyrimidine-DNA glycosylase|nr:bifunctional DNA-formamidopyrimidine glycosylase/DNA-(apurinic or apyrimidinic site) lyase [Candidatus Limnocylindria bacterium]
MPELPEVETIARQLRDLVVGRRVAAFESFWHRVTEPVPAAHFATRLAGREITGVGRRGKFIVLELDGGEALIVSLRMTGKLLFREPGSAEDTFVRAVIGFADGTALRFSDTRKFGRMAIVDRADLVEDGDRGASPPEDPRRARLPLHRVLGIEPLSPRFTTRWLRDFLQLRGRSAIKPLLLDQRGIAGVGNIYDIEALWRARIHPLRTAGSLRAGEIARLRAALRFVLRKGIRLGGASRRDYVDARGGQGRMQREFMVYDRAGEPCPRCGRAIVRTVVGGRGTFHCPRCQKAPATRVGRRRRAG